MLMKKKFLYIVIPSVVIAATVVATSVSARMGVPVQVKKGSSQVTNPVPTTPPETPPAPSDPDSNPNPPEEPVTPPVSEPTTPQPQPSVSVRDKARQEITDSYGQREWECFEHFVEFRYGWANATQANVDAIKAMVGDTTPCNAVIYFRGTISPPDPEPSPEGTEPTPSVIL